MIKSSSLLGVAALLAKVTAHGFVQGIDVDGTYHTGYLVTSFPYQQTAPAVVGWATTAKDLGFVAPAAYSTPDIICHQAASNAQLSATVRAGGTIRLDWNTWPESHHGPVIDYLAPCANGDCATVDKTTLEFFKIDEGGLVDGSAQPGKWASDELIAKNNSWTVTIPSTIAPGPYVLRHEIIALHSALDANGAQNYPQCINLLVTGSGTDKPAGVRGEKLYTQTDPGILVNIYNNGLSYTIPGPKLFSAGSGGVATATPAPSPSTIVVTTPTTFATSTTTSAAPAATPTDGDDGNTNTCEL